MTAAANNARSTRGTRESTIRRAHKMTMFGRNISRFFIRLFSSPLGISRLRPRFSYEFDSTNSLCRHFPPILIQNQLGHLSRFILDESNLRFDYLEKELCLRGWKQLELGLTRRLSHQLTVFAGDGNDETWR